LRTGRTRPHWWTLASPENYRVDIAPWQDVEDVDS
jgi:hypothetical protein